MNDLMLLLDRAAGTGPDTDPAADLARGRRALARTRRRRAAGGLVGVAAAGLLGVGTAQRVTADDTAAPLAERPGEQGTDTPHLHSEVETAGPYTFTRTPFGWSVQDHRPQVVVFHKDDGSSQGGPDVFAEKVVLLLDPHAPSGSAVVRDGRSFWVRDGGGTLIVATTTRAGEPDGTLLLQVPEELGWSADTAMELLDGVRVGPGAEPFAYDPDATYEEVPGGYIIFGDGD